ncbi:hypothetical protein, partial [Hallella sp.]|uniref:hypothetical protein n=1 Tax=Hallella sp. TaxID=2980186 RepID=UPI003079DA17
EFFSSFFSSANIIERAKALIINAFALAGRVCLYQSVNPGCRFACPGLCAHWAFSPSIIGCTLTKQAGDHR